MKFELIKHISLLVTILLTISTSITAQETTSNEKVTLGMKCGNKVSRYRLNNFKIDVLRFLPADTINFDIMPTIIGGTDSLIKKIYSPEIARRAGVEGIVTIEFIVDVGGNATNFDILKSLGAGWEESILNALALQKFSPTIKDNRILSSKMYIDIGITIKDVTYVDTVKDFLPRPIYLFKNDIENKFKLSLYPPPTKEKSDTLDTTGN